MSEVPSDFRRVTPIQNYNPKPYTVGEVPVASIRCEDCPASPVCKKINNFRPSCDPKSGRKSDGVEKCMAGTNILLAKLLDALSMKG